MKAKQLTLFRYALALLCVIAIWPVAAAQAQDAGPFHGVYADYSVNMHTADFQRLPGLPNCCPRYEEGTGNGVAFGVLYGFPLNNRFTFQVRAGFTPLSGHLSKAEPTTVLLLNTPVAGEFTHSLDAQLGAAGLEPMAGVRLFGNLHLNAGLRAAVLLSGGYDQREQITQPDGAGTFVDSLGRDTRSRIRNAFSGDIPDLSRFQLAAFAGLAWHLPLNADRSWQIWPQAWYALGITPVASGLQWHVNTLRVGLAIVYAPHTDTEVRTRRQQADTLYIKRVDVTATRFAQGRTAYRTDTTASGGVRYLTEIVSRTDTIFTPAPPPARDPAPTVTVTGLLPDGAEAPAENLRVEEFASTLMTPLLPYVFFDENSARIPPRYNLLSQADTGGFAVERANSAAKLPTYYHLLNIVCRRLLDNPSATVTLTGCNQDIRGEQGNTALSRGRALAVKQYMTDRWHIADARIKVEARNLPQKAANTTTQDGSEENRRVEITSSNPAVLAPVITSDTLRIATPSTLRFHASAPPSGVATAGWRLDIEQNGALLKRFQGTGAVPEALEWNIAQEPGSVPQYDGPVDYRLSVMAGVGDTSPVTRRGRLAVEQVSIRKKRAQMQGDKEIDRYSLILFEVRSADITAAQAGVVTLIKNRVQPASTVTVTGYTDRLGEAAYNQGLAASRAATVAKALGAANSTARGVGQADLYDSALPEGRLYTRTVDVVIETPVR